MSMRPVITRTEPGNIEINGQTFGDKDLLLHWDSVSDYDRLPHVQRKHYDEFTLREPEALIIGTGFSETLKVDPQIVKLAKLEKKDLHILPTKLALNKFDELSKRGKKVVAFIHTRR